MVMGQHGVFVVHPKTRIFVCLHVHELGCRSTVLCSLICVLSHIDKRAETHTQFVVMPCWCLHFVRVQVLCFNSASFPDVWYSPHFRWKGWDVPKRGWLGGGYVSGFVLFLFMSGSLIICILSVFHFVLNFEWSWCPFDV